MSELRDAAHVDTVKGSLARASREDKGGRWEEGMDSFRACAVSDDDEE